MELTERDKKLLYGILIGFFILSFLITKIIIARRSSLYSKLSVKATNEISEMKAISQEMKKNFDPRAQKLLTQDFSLLSFIETVSNEVGLKPESIKPISDENMGSLRKIAVTITARGTTIDAVTKFLFKIEKNDMPLRVDRFQIKSSYASPNLLDLSMDISGFTKIK